MCDESILICHEKMLPIGAEVNVGASPLTTIQKTTFGDLETLQRSANMLYSVERRLLALEHHIFKALFTFKVLENSLKLSQCLDIQLTLSELKARIAKTKHIARKLAISRNLEPARVKVIEAISKKLLTVFGTEQMTNKSLKNIQVSLSGTIGAFKPFDWLLDNPDWNIQK